ncbi:MAG: PEP-CTERM sorting domain-containing protein [Planctomycetaceae bacterium]|nr:PEP-CTERM sorting domain-containing protein [Planctomycetaceae bacterium]
MKNVFYCFIFASVLAMLSASTVLADIDTDSGAADTTGLLGAFNLAVKSGQETSNGCTMNPMEGNQQVITSLLPLPELQQVAYTNTFNPTDSITRTQDTPNMPNTPRYPPPPPPGPPPPPTPEPGTLLIMGIGATAMIPLLRRKHAGKAEETV